MLFLEVRASRDEACLVREAITHIANGASVYPEAKRLNYEGEPLLGGRTTQTDQSRIGQPSIVA